MTKRPLCIAFLWHMHQPDYRNSQTGELCLPWTRFHAVKDYYDMGALVAGVPGTHLTINLVPSLTDQLVSYARGTAREVHATLSLRNAAALDEQEKAFLLRSFFQLSWKYMVYPYARYRELLELRGGQDENGNFPEGLESYTVQDYRDLQTWYNLTWCGHELRRDPEIAALFAKGGEFSEEDKKRLLDLQYSFIGRILPSYQRLMEEQGIEFSQSPYYHPILPLLCDSHCALESQPGIHLPPEPFSFPSDAREQICRGMERHKEIFDRMPMGMWPSEGAISDAALALCRESGLRWLASDEGLLANSLQKSGRLNGHLRPEQKFSAHSWGQGNEGPCLFFRDRGLSDLIGFTYSGWDAQDAVADFLSHLRRIHEGLPDDGRHYVVPVILDGENAWEHYPENGAPFLRSLYRRLTESSEFRTVTFSEFLDLEPHREQLESVVAGSWIYSNLATWIGHEEKNRAWEELTVARQFLETGMAGNAGGTTVQSAFQEMLIAEGSDWFWWYGDDHQSENAAEFDALFRGHIRNVYTLIGRPYPPSLDIPIKRTEVKARHRNPVHTITPKLDGQVTDYFEWLAAGFAFPSAGESMHRSERQFESMYFGYDAARFYLRIDLKDLKEGRFPQGRSLMIRFLAPVEFAMDITCGDHGHWHCKTATTRVPEPDLRFAADKVMEIGIPLDALGIRKPEEARFFALLIERNHELERFPDNGFLAVPVDPWGLDQREWMV
jgi:alpha-amylase/alpha-mannosidase (GH57 family)